MKFIKFPKANKFTMAGRLSMIAIDMAGILINSSIYFRTGILH